MKKWGWKKISAVGLTLSLALSMTAFASEVQMEDMEDTEQTETVEEEQKKENNGLESHIFLMEKKSREKETEQTEQEFSETFGIKSVTLEELEDIKYASVVSEQDVKTPSETVIILFQPENFWNQENIEETEASTEEMKTIETILDPVQEVMREAETESETAVKEELPVLALTKEQKEQVTQASSFSEEILVVVNGGTLEDESLFRTQKKVKAVLSMNERTEKSFKEALKELPLEQVYAEYQEKMKETAGEENKRPVLKTAEKEEEYKPQAESVLPGNTLSKSGTSTGTTGIQTPTDTETEENSTAPGNSVQGTSGTTGTTGSGSESETTATKKNIILTMVPDGLEDGDDVLYAVYKISCPDDVKISEGSFKLTYDSTKMSYDKDYSDAGMDSMDDFTYTGTDNTGILTMDLKSNNGTALTLNGEILDLGFELKEMTKTGDIYNLKLEVISLKNGSTELTTDSNYTITVQEDSIKTVAAEGDDIEEETETQTQTQTQTQTETQTQTQSLQKAAKTDDKTNAVLWLILLTASALLIGGISFKRELYRVK